MKRKILEEMALRLGCDLVEGGNHTKVYHRGRRITEIPRHNEVNELTAKTIIKALKRGTAS